MIVPLGSFCKIALTRRFQSGKGGGYLLNAREFHFETRSRCRSRDLQHDFAVVLAVFEKLIGFDGASSGNTWPICGVSLPSAIHAENCVPRRLHDLRASATDTSATDPARWRIWHTWRAVDLRLLAGRGAVLDDASEVAQAAQALGGVLAAEHFEDGVHAFAVREILHDFFIVVLLVVDGVLQAESFDARKLILGGRGPVHFDAEELADLDCGSADASGDGVNEDARSALR